MSGPSVGAAESAAPALTVSELTRMLRATLEARFADVWVEGEISELKVSARGHAYFTLKDEGAQLPCVQWASARRSTRFELKPGLKVVVAGSVTVYEPRGAYQLVVGRVQPSGIGELALAFEQRKQKLAAEGLFDPARKRPLPGFVSRVALVTSPQGAAVRDLLTVMLRRSPDLHVVLFPTPVQGDEAPTGIVAAIEAANTMGGFDVLIVGRGGGSAEDLWAFNDEAVVRAIAASAIPTVSAVGHEVDVTLSDFAADLRAATPSAAAELVVPVAAELKLTVSDLAQRLYRAATRGIERFAERVARLAQHPALRDPAYRVRQAAQQVDELSERLALAAARIVPDRGSRIESLSGRLNALSPLAVLSRGYAIAFALPARAVLTDASAVAAGQPIELRLHRGSLEARVTGMLPGPGNPGGA